MYFKIIFVILITFRCEKICVDQQACVFMSASVYGYWLTIERMAFSRESFVVIMAVHTATVNK